MSVGIGRGKSWSEYDVPARLAGTCNNEMNNMNNERSPLHTVAEKTEGARHDAPSCVHLFDRAFLLDVLGDMDAWADQCARMCLDSVVVPLLIKHGAIKTSRAFIEEVVSNVIIETLPRVSGGDFSWNMCPADAAALNTVMRRFQEWALRHDRMECLDAITSAYTALNLASSAHPTVVGRALSEFVDDVVHGHWLHCAAEPRYVQIDVGWAWASVCESYVAGSDIMRQMAAAVEQSAEGGSIVTSKMIETLPRPTVYDDDYGVIDMESLESMVEGYGGSMTLKTFMEGLDKEAKRWIIQHMILPPNDEDRKLAVFADCALEYAQHVDCAPHAKTEKGEPLRGYAYGEFVRNHELFKARV